MSTPGYRSKSVEELRDTSGLTTPEIMGYRHVRDVPAGMAQTQVDLLRKRNPTCSVMTGEPRTPQSGTSAFT